MTSEEIWRSKADAEILVAADRLADFTEEGDRIIRAELRRRGLPQPPPPIGSCQHCGRSIPASHPGSRCQQCGESLGSEVAKRIDDSAYRPGLSPRAVVVVSGLIVWPVWFGILVGAGVFIEEVLGWEGPVGSKWLVNLAAFSIIGIGFFLWRVVGSMVAARWARPVPRRNAT